MKIKLAFVFVFALLFWQCGEDKKFTVLKVKDEKSGYELHWYYYSYITSMPESVDLINPDGDEELICKAPLITDVKFKTKDTIEIEMMKCDNCNPYFIEKNIDGFNVIIKKGENYDNVMDRRLERERLRHDSLLLKQDTIQ